MAAADSYPDIGTLCRLCLKEHKDAYTIFAEDDSQLSIPMRIIACVALEAKSTDGLPKKICAECRYQLEKSFLFRQRSQAADKKFRKHIRLLGLGKKSRVFSKPLDDYDEDELEFEDSLIFIKNQEQLRDKAQTELSDKCAREMKKELEKEMQNKLAAEKIALRSKVIEQVRLDISEEVRSGLRQQLLEEVQEESRKEQLAKLMGELEIFLREKKAGLWEVVNEVAIETKSNVATTVLTTEASAVNATCRKRRITKSPEVQQTQYAKIENTDNEESDEDVTLAGSEVDTAVITQDLQEIQMACAAKEMQNQGSEIYIINNFSVEDAKTEVPKTEYQIESLEENITSYNIRDNGEIQFSDGKDSTQMQNVVVLDLDADLGDDLQLSDFDHDVIILPNHKSEGAADMESLPVKRTLNDFVVKQLVKKDDENVPKAGRASDTLKTFRCQLCPIEFPTENSWTRHLNTHIKTMKKGKGGGFKCPICELHLSNASSLKRHMIIHTGVKPHKCEECNQAFVQREVLKRHMTIHTGEKRHQCPHCPSRFAQKTNLRQHVAKVHMDMPLLHKCHLCTRSFSHLSGLSRHLVTHAGVMFACKECGRQFSDRSSIKRHVENVHNIRDKQADVFVAQAETILNNC